MAHSATLIAADHHYRALGTLLGWLVSLDAHFLRVVALGSLLYAFVFYAEGVGLLLHRRWAELMTIVTTAGLVPFELFELHGRVTVTKLTVLLANLLILAYLSRRVATKRAER